MTLQREPKRLRGQTFMKTPNGKDHVIPELWTNGHEFWHEMPTKPSSQMKVYYCLSLNWGEVAISMNENAGLGLGPNGSPKDLGALVIAQVSFGYAVELAYKCLLIATGKEVIATHDILDLHKQLDTDRQGDIEWHAKIGFDSQGHRLPQDPCEGRDIIKYVNKVFCNPNVKYFGFPTKSIDGHVGIPPDLEFATRPDRTVADLIHLHSIILQIARAFADGRLDGLPMHSASGIHATLTQSP